MHVFWAGFGLGLLVASVAASGSLVARVAQPASVRIAMDTSAVRPERPRRIASLDACTDELALLLAAPGQLISVSRAGADPRQSLLSARAAGLKTNDGRVADVTGMGPDLLLIDGGDGNAANTARELGIAAAAVPQPRSLAEVRDTVRKVALALALGRPEAGARLIARMDGDLGVPSARPLATLMVDGGGKTIAPEGLAAQWLRHAGLQQQPIMPGMVDFGRLQRDPPRVLLIVRQQPGLVGGNQSWRANPAMKTLPPQVRLVETDGRAWACPGPARAAEAARLRSVVHALR
ncbi:hypothetical protein GCM10011529_11190 [Polymorphobacter glacialis]|uniref:ABC transporter substrate-binding protein n=1 Tax=Sandarakinorhabdus glacialis TaxID=1614636 RepID=A0A916ZPM8_9SPHN|nr:ABC transporter substrate-binding protein [Polymorphobacter glacialis]GGE06557.1 hypothetical protein GCM10011529_11190 [Polymorphobacter glacialis]